MSSGMCIRCGASHSMVRDNVVDASCLVCGHVTYGSVGVVEGLGKTLKGSDRAGGYGAKVWVTRRETEREIREAVRLGWSNMTIMRYYAVGLQTALRQRERVQNGD